MDDNQIVSGEKVHSDGEKKIRHDSARAKKGCNQTICLFVFTCIFFAISYVSMIVFPNFKFFRFGSPCQSYTLDITAIVLGAISAFIAILIPLHYSIVLDIVQKIIDSDITDNNAKDEIKVLQLYVASSDIIIAITAIFGISSLLSGAVAMAVHLQIIPENNSYLKTISIVYLILVSASIARSFCLMKKSKLKKREDNRFNRQYIAYITCLLLAGSISTCWARSLYHFKMPHHNAFEALIALALFYLIWLFLKLPFIPINRVERLYKKLS